MMQDNNLIELVPNTNNCLRLENSKDRELTEMSNDSLWNYLDFQKR